MVNIANPGEIDVENISRPSADELPSEDRQSYEVFIKDCEEESRRRKEKNRRKASKKSVGGSCLTFPRIERVMSPRTRRWLFFQRRRSMPNQTQM